MVNLLVYHRRVCGVVVGVSETTGAGNAGRNESDYQIASYTEWSFLPVRWFKGPLGAMSGLAVFRYPSGFCFLKGFLGELRAAGGF